MSGVTKREKEKFQPVKVFVRLRPLNDQECRSCIEVLNSCDLFVKRLHEKKYTFDGVFAPGSAQQTIYETVINPLIVEVLAGYNCTVFAYGQTGTGKTYTMTGLTPSVINANWKNDQHIGIIPRAVADLFDELWLSQQEYTMRVSYLELYNEELYDLLSDNDSNARIKLYEDLRHKGSVLIQGIVEQTVRDKHEVFRILEKGQEKRRTASTLMNHQSSRSHTVFCITVHIRETSTSGETLVKTGKLNLVDLAGSENVNKSGAVDLRAREAGNINQSLLNLGRVIKALVENCTHIPYRASKLTRILQDSLGGRTKTSIIATISPSTTCLDETLNTLNYVSQAKNITNKPEINQCLSQKSLLTKYEEEIERLRKDLVAARTGNGLYLNQENYNKLMQEEHVSSEKLAEKVVVIRELEHQLKHLEKGKEVLVTQWNQLNASFCETNTELARYRNMLKMVEMQKEENEHLANCYRRNVETLYEQAETLLNINKTASSKEITLCDKTEKLYIHVQGNHQIMEYLGKIVETICDSMVTDLNKFMVNCDEQKIHVNKLIDQFQSVQEDNRNRISLIRNHVMEQVGNLFELFNDAANEQTDLEVWIEKFCDHYKNYEKLVSDVQQWTINNIFDYLQNDLEDITIKCVEYFQQFENKAMLLRDDGTSSRDNTICDLKAINENLLSDIDELITQLSSGSESYDNSLTEFIKWREDVNRVFDTGFNSLQSKLEHSKEAHSNILSSAGYLKNNIECFIPQVQKEVDTCLAKNMSVYSDLQNIFEKDNIQTDCMLAHEQIKQEHVSAIKTEELSSKENFNRMVKNFAICSNDFVKTNSKLFSDLRDLLDENLSKLNEYMTTENMSQCETDTVLKEVEDIKNLLLENHKSLSSKLQNQKTAVNNIHKNINEVKHAGDTPVKTNRRPTILKQLSPEEQLLLKYRLQREEMCTTKENIPPQ